MQWMRIASTTMAALWCAGALAQGAATFPSKPVTIVLPFPPGASTDLEARLYQDGLSAQLKNPVVIDYKPGGSGVIANGYVARSAPDGHTMAFVSSSVTILPAVRKDIPYDLAKDFAPVILTTENILVLLVRPNFPAQTFEQWVAYAKSKPGAVTWSTVGQGRGFHVGGEWLASELGIDLTMVHYKGGAQAELDLMGGRIDTTPKQLPPSLPLIKAGKVKVLAILTGERSPLLPGIKTVAEMGAPKFSYPNWVGLVAPAGTPVAIVNRLNTEVAKTIKTPEAMKRWDSQGSVVVASTPEAFRKRILAEMVIWDKVAKEKNITED